MAAAVGAGQRLRRGGLVLVWLALLCAACGSPTEEAVERLPNEGAVIQIATPPNGKVFPAGREIEVAVEVRGIELGGEAGYHWHIYVDGENWGMVFEGRRSHALFGVGPGEHEVAVYLANAEHVELEAGDMLRVIVEE